MAINKIFIFFKQILDNIYLQLTILSYNRMANGAKYCDQIDPCMLWNILHQLYVLSIKLLW